MPTRRDEPGSASKSRRNVRVLQKSSRQEHPGVRGLSDVKCCGLRQTHAAFGLARPRSSLAGWDRTRANCEASRRRLGVVTAKPSY
jgi:hypothetical protein